MKEKKEEKCAKMADRGKNTSHLEMEEVGVAKEKENGPTNQPTNQISLPFNSNLVAKQQVVFFGSPLL